MALYILDEIYCIGEINVVTENSNILESCFVNIEINSKEIVFGVLYRSWYQYLKKY